jgi:hypothetical protein
MEVTVITYIYDKSGKVKKVDSISLTNTIHHVLNNTRSFNFDKKYNKVIESLIKEFHITNYVVKDNGTCNTIVFVMNESDLNRFYQRFEQVVFGG